MKHLTAALLALLLLLGLCACDGRGRSASTDSDLSGEELQELIERELAED